MRKMSKKDIIITTIAFLLVLCCLVFEFVTVPDGIKSFTHGITAIYMLAGLVYYGFKP